MKHASSHATGRRGRRRPRRRNKAVGRGPSRQPQARSKGFFDRIGEFFGKLFQPQKSARKPPPRTATRSPLISKPAPAEQKRAGSQRPSSRKPEVVEVTTPRLYVGNLAYEATESDLFELFNGVGSVQNAEVVSHKQTQRSKGFAFVQMQTVEEARRAVEVLHDKEFLGRKLVVSGAKADQHE